MFAQHYRGFLDFNNLASVRLGNYGTWFIVHSEGALSSLKPLNLGASEFVPGIIERTTNPFSAT